MNYRIGGTDKLVHTDREFHTSYSSSEFILKYWGTDDNGFDIYIEQVMIVNGASHNP